MTLRKELWTDRFAVDGSRINAETDGGTVSFLDYGALTTMHTAAVDQSGSATGRSVAPSEAEVSSLTFDELSALYPGGVGSRSAEQIAASTTDDSIALPRASSQTAIETPQASGPAGLDWWVTPDFDDDPDWHAGGVRSHEQLVASTTDDSIALPRASSQTAIETPQATGPAGLDWWVTPDFDDDPDWHPGGVGPPSAERNSASTTDGGIALPIAVTDSAEARLTVPQDETQTSSLTFDEVSEQYPGIVWPVNWWLL